MKKIMYISIQIPSLTQTFVDREIKVLREFGYSVKSISRFSPKNKVTRSKYIEEDSETLYIDKAKTFFLYYCQLYIVIKKFYEWVRIVKYILNEKEVKNNKDRMRLFKHFLEAGYVYMLFKNEIPYHIHANFLNAPTSIAFFLSILFKVPFTFTMHASNIFVDPLMLKKKIEHCKVAITISKYNKNYLCERYGNYISDKIKIIHCGIDLKNYEPSSRCQYDFPIILSVGRLVEMKGFSILLEACKLLSDRGKKYICYIIGDGEESIKLKNKATSLGLYDCVVFCGSQTHETILDYLQKASLFVLPCYVTENGKRDGIPVAIMEAMAMELPVVSTHIVGIPELIEHGKEGILVPPQNYIELANAIEYFLENSEEMERMGKNGRLKIMKDFDIAKVPLLFDKYIIN